jgi:hypothetical protein
MAVKLKVLNHHDKGSHDNHHRDPEHEELERQPKKRIWTSLFRWLLC